jgi:hypothetical protein
MNDATPSRPIKFKFILQLAVLVSVILITHAVRTAIFD